MSRAVITQRTDTLTHPRLGWHLLWMLHMAFFLCLLSANACASKEKIEGSRMETDGEWRYGYDKDGNLVERYKGSGKWWDAKREHWKYAWNDFVKSDEQSGTCSGFAMARNRTFKNQNGSLAGVQCPDRHGHWVELTYDALGRRLSKSASEQTNWLWNGNVPLHEWTSGQRYEEKGWKPYEEDFKTWIFEEESFVPLALLQDGHTYSIMTDHLGTPTEMYDENGEEVWYRQLDMNGKIIKEECHRRTSYYKNVTVPFLFQGQYYDYETELAYNRFRYYSPNMGCYISQDPIGLAGDNPTLYGFVEDTNGWIDVWGLYKSCYRKRSKGNVKRMRKSFNKKKRKEFVIYLANKHEDYLRSKGISASDIAKMKNGKVPPGYEIHHIVPLYRGGSNNKNNLILMEKEYHKINSSTLHDYDEALNPFDNQYIKDNFIS